MGFELPTQRRIRILRDEDPGKPAWYDAWQENLKEEQDRFVHEQYVGIMPVRTELQVILPDNPSQRSVGFFVHEFIGVGIMNPRSSIGIITDVDDANIELIDE